MTKRQIRNPNAPKPPRAEQKPDAPPTARPYPTTGGYRGAEAVGEVKVPTSAGASSNTPSGVRLRQPGEIPPKSTCCGAYMAEFGIADGVLYEISIVDHCPHCGKPAAAVHLNSTADDRRVLGQEACAAAIRALKEARG